MAQRSKRFQACRAHLILRLANRLVFGGNTQVEDVSQMNKRTTMFFLAMGLPVAILGLLIFSDQRLKSGYDQIAEGASQAEVRQILGDPHAVLECASFGGKPPSGSTTEFSYFSAATFWDVWVLSFDANDRVIRKLRYKSP